MCLNGIVRIERKGSGAIRSLRALFFCCKCKADILIADVSVVVEIVVDENAFAVDDFRILSPVLNGRHLNEIAEYAVEGAHAGETTLKGDVGDRFLCADEFIPGIVNAFHIAELLKGQAGIFTEKVGEIVIVITECGRDVFERQIFLEMCRDIVHHFDQHQVAFAISIRNDFAVGDKAVTKPVENAGKKVFVDLRVVVKILKKHLMNQRFGGEDLRFSMGGGHVLGKRGDIFAGKDENHRLGRFQSSVGVNLPWEDNAVLAS